jgi:hypothetical protein
MGDARRPGPVNLICGILAAREQWLDAAKDRLEKAFGYVDLESDVWPFDFTDYYESEMGGPLLRRIYSFAELIQPDNLPMVKRTTNRLEKELSAELEDSPQRPVNLDPGYVDSSKLVLATTKDHAHRLYLGGGIYAESTLRWFQGDFVPWDWTYPDYRTERYRDFFADVRRLHEEKLDNLGTAQYPAADPH